MLISEPTCCSLPTSSWDSPTLPGSRIITRRWLCPPLSDDSLRQPPSLLSNASCSPPDLPEKPSPNLRKGMEQKGLIKSLYITISINSQAQACYAGVGVGIHGAIWESQLSNALRATQRRSSPLLEMVFLCPTTSNVKPDPGCLPRHEASPPAQPPALRRNANGIWGSFPRVWGVLGPSAEPWPSHLYLFQKGHLVTPVPVYSHIGQQFWRITEPPDQSGAGFLWDTGTALAERSSAPRVLRRQGHRAGPFMEASPMMRIQAVV